MISLSTVLIICIALIVGMLSGMFLGHYITLKATAAFTDLEEKITSAISTFHQRLVTVEDKILVPFKVVKTDTKKVETAIEDAIDVVKTDLHKDTEEIPADVTNTEKKVTNDIQSISNFIKHI